jgi:hypothetical protein
MRLIVTSIAGGVVIFVALALIWSIIRGGKRAFWEILRVTAGLVCLALAGLSGHGNIGPWGIWVGLGGLSITLLAALFADRVGANNG